MTRTVLVTEVLERGLCKVEMKRESACGGSCSTCGGCGADGGNVTALAVNVAGAAAGETVVVESRGKDIFGIAALVYIVPVILLIAGYIIAASVSAHPYAQGIGSAAGFTAGILAAVFYGKRKKGKVYLTVTELVSGENAKS